MYRVTLAAAAAVTLTGCSLGSVGISSGFAEAPSDRFRRCIVIVRIQEEQSAPSAARRRPNARTALQTGTKVAALPDKAPTGTFEKAPAGALQDRDYSGTSLNPGDGARSHQSVPPREGPEAPEAQSRADGSRERAFARSRQVGSHLALRLGRLEPVGSREAHGLQGQARGRERRHGPGQLRRGLERLEGKPRPQQEPAAWATRRKWASRWCRIPRPSSSRSGRWSSAPPCEALLREPAASSKTRSNFHAPDPVSLAHFI